MTTQYFVLVKLLDSLESLRSHLWLEVLIRGKTKEPASVSVYRVLLCLNFNSGSSWLTTMGERIAEPGTAANVPSESFFMYVNYSHRL